MVLLPYGQTGQRLFITLGEAQGSISMQDIHIRLIPGIKAREMAPITKKIMIAAMIMAIVYPVDFSCGDFIRTGNPT